jgi:site-specific DNA-methyltransferase (adenine-specific)
MTHRLHIDDCRAAMRTLADASVDLILTDPPYGVGYRPARTARKPGHPWRRIIGDDHFDEDLYRAWLADGYRVLRPDRHLYCFCADVHLGTVRRLVGEAGFRVKRTVVWEKPSWTLGDCRGDYGHQTEFIVFAHKGRRELMPPRQGNVLHFARVPARRMEHPTEKPVELLRYLILKSAPPGGVVLDPFCGSGSTGVAAKLEGCSSIQIELDPTYAAAAKRRLATTAATEEELALAG